MPRILLDFPGIKGQSLIRHYKNLAECFSFDLTSGKREVGGFNYDDPIEDDSYFGGRKSSQKLNKLGVDNLKLERHFDLASPKLMQAAFDPQKKDVTATTIAGTRESPTVRYAKAVSPARTRGRGRTSGAGRSWLMA